MIEIKFDKEKELLRGVSGYSLDVIVFLIHQHNLHRYVQFCDISIGVGENWKYLSKDI